MARRKTKALRRARLDQPGALAAFSPAALAFLVYGFLTWFAYLLFAMYGNFPVEGEPIDPDFAWAETIRWLGHGGARTPLLPMRRKVFGPTTQNEPFIPSPHRTPDHLEFTREQGAVAGGAPSAEHLLAFYLPDESEWTATCADVDGYRVVLANFAWAK